MGLGRRAQRCALRAKVEVGDTWAPLQKNLGIGKKSGRIESRDRSTPLRSHLGPRNTRRQLLVRGRRYKSPQKCLAAAENPPYLSGGAWLPLVYQSRIFRFFLLPHPFLSIERSGARKQFSFGKTGLRFRCEISCSPSSQPARRYIFRPLK